MNTTDDEQWHIVPLHDLREHDTTAYCWCNPERNDEEIFPIFVHNSMDGREDFETGKRLPS